MAIDQFQITRNPFQPANTLQPSAGGTQSTDQTPGTAQTLPSDLNPYNVNVVNEIVRRGRADVAEAKYPYEYKALYGGQQQQPTQTGKVRVYNRATDSYSEVDVGAEQAAKYDPDNWETSPKQFDASVLNHDLTDEDRAYADRVASKVDYSKIGAINGNDKTDAYRLFDTSAMLPTLFRRYTGLRPEEVMAMNFYDRQEVATKLLNDYYHRASPAVQQQIGDKDRWVQNVLHRFGMADGDESNDDVPTTLWNLGKGVVRGVGDQFQNYWESAKTLVGANGMTQDEIAAEKANQRYREQDRTKSETAILQRFDSLMADERYDEAAIFLASHPDAYGALMGSTLGGLVADAMVTTGVMAAVGSVAPGLGTAAGAAAGATASAAKLASKLQSLAKTGTFIGVSGMGMHGSLAKELMVDGNVIEPGSELYKQLLLYGVIGSAISAVTPGTIESSVIKKILASKAGQGMSEEAASGIAKQFLGALKKKGYTLTENGIRRPALRGGLEWGTKLATKIGAESGTEYVQEGWGEAIKQAANTDGTVDYSKVNADKVHAAGMKGAVLALPLGGVNAAIETGGGYLGRNEQLRRDKAIYDAAQQRLAEEKAAEDAYNEWKSNRTAGEITGLKSDIDFGMYDADGNRLGPESDYEQPTFNSREERDAYNAALEDKILRKQYEEFKQQQATTEPNSPTPEVETEAETSPQPSGTQDNTDPELADDLVVSQDLNEAGYGYIHTKASPVKDLRQYNTRGRDVDVMWDTVRKDAETWLRGVDNKIKTLQDKAVKVRDSINDKLPESIRVSKETEAQGYEAQADDLTAEKSRITNLLRDARDVDGVDNFIYEASQIDGVIHTVRATAAGANLQQIAEHGRASGNIAYMPNATDGKTRFSMADRQRTLGELAAVAEMANVPAVGNSGDLVAAVDKVRTDIQQSKYSGTPRLQRALYKLNAIEKAVTHNRPELLDNVKSVDSKLKDVEGVVHPLYNKTETAAVAGGQLRYLRETFDTAKHKGSSGTKVSVFDKDFRDDISKNVAEYKYAPLETLETIKDKVLNYVNRLESENSLSNVEQIATIYGVLGNLNDAIADLKAGKVIIRTPRSSSTRQYVQLGDKKIYDPVLKDIPGDELHEYINDIRDIESTFGIQGVEPSIEQDVSAHVANLRRHLNETKSHTGAPLVYGGKNQFVVWTLFGSKSDRFRYGEEVATTLDNYLHDIEKRVKTIRGKQINPGVEVSAPADLDALPHGSLVRAAIEEHRNPHSGTIRGSVNAERDRLNNILEPSDSRVEYAVADVAGVNADDLLPPPEPEQTKGAGSTELALIAGEDYTPTRGVDEFSLAGTGKRVVLNTQFHGERSKRDADGNVLPREERREAFAHNRGRQELRDQFKTDRLAPGELQRLQEENERASQERSREYQEDLNRQAQKAMSLYDQSMRAWNILQGNTVWMTTGGRRRFIPKFTAMAELYEMASQSVGAKTPENIAAYARAVLGEIGKNNPDVLDAETVALVTEQVANVGAVQAWMDTQGKVSKAKRQQVMQDQFGALNNELLSRALSSGGEIRLDDLGGLIGNMALWYKDQGYDNVAGVLSVVVSDKDLGDLGRPDALELRKDKAGRRRVARQRGIAANTKIVLVEADEFSRLTGIDEVDNVHGAYVLSRKRNGTRMEVESSVIYINSTANQDIAKTLVHELGHVAWAELFGDNGWSVSRSVFKTEERNLLNAANAGTIAVEPLVEAGILAEDPANVREDGTLRYKLTEDGVEELIMHNLDSTFTAKNAQQSDPNAAAFQQALRVMFGDVDIDTVLHKLAARTTGHRYHAAGVTSAQSPVLRGFDTTVKVKKRAGRNQFTKQPNPEKPKDTTTVYHFGFHEDNDMVSADPMAWWDGNAWSFYYVDRNGEAQRTTGLSANEVMQLAQELNLYIEQREKDIILQSESKRVDQFLHFSPPIATMWKGVNRLFGGDDYNVSPLVRSLMSFTQKWAVEQHGADQFFKMFENVVSAVSGTDKEGVLTTRINEIRTRINHQLNNYGVGGETTMFELREELMKFLGDAGWSEQKANDVLYAMRAEEYYTRIYKRQKEDPKWKGKPFDATQNLSGFKFKDENGKDVDDPTGEKYWSRLSDQDKNIANALRQLVINLNNSVIQIEFDSGRISQDQYNDQYNKFYVPLKNESDKATAFQRMAVGRHTKADKPLSHLLANHQARLHAAEQTMIYQAFMDLMEQHPVKGFATFNSSTLKNKGDGEYAMSADGFIDGTSVTFYRNGEKVNMTITHPAMAEAIKKRKGEAASVYLNAVTKATGWLGLTRTALPTFAKTAFFRDLGMAFVNVQAAFRGKEKMSPLEWLALGSKTARDMVRYAPIMFKARMNPKDADWRYKVYRSEGGIGNVTGYDIESVNAALERDVFDRKSAKSKVKTGARKYLDVLHVSDDAARFSLWMNYLEHKHGGPFQSEQELAAFLKDHKDIANIARDASKNITGNFEQRGMSRRLRSHFVFWNAIQAGTRNIYGLLNPRYGYFGISALSALMGLIMMTGSDEEDEDGKLKSGRMKGLGNNLYLGDFQVNVAQEIRPFTHLAEGMKYYLRGDWDFDKMFNHVANGIAQAVAPWQMAETGDTLTDAAYALTPTMLQPLVLQIAGKNYFGGELAPAPYDSDGKQWADAPDAFRATSGTTALSAAVAKAMYHFTGGGIDVAPGSLDMFQQQFLGSAFTIAKDIVKRVNKGENYLEAVGSQFTKGHVREYNEFALKDEVMDRFKSSMQRYKLGEDDQILGKSSQTPEYEELSDLFKAMDKELDSLTGEDGASTMTDLYTQLNNVKASSSPSPDEFLRITSQIEQIRQTRNAIYGKYNRILMEMGY